MLMGFGSELLSSTLIAFIISFEPLFLCCLFGFIVLACWSGCMLEVLLVRSMFCDAFAPELCFWSLIFMFGRMAYEDELTIYFFPL